MHCGLCHKNVASLTLMRAVDGVAQELRVCKACAAKHGFDHQLPIPQLTDLLLACEAAPPPSDEHVCTGCHMHQADFHKTSLLGCPACYTAFVAEVEGLLVSMHKGTRHFGKVPRKRTVAFLRALEQAIDAAIEARDLETANLLRQHLRNVVRQSASRALRHQQLAGTDAKQARS